jgi:DNA-binding IclR family transcriptional regulator
MSTPRNHSIQKAFAVLRQFRSKDECLTGAELSRRAGLPGASGYRIVATLAEVGAVVRTQSGRYRLGSFLAGEPETAAGVRDWLPSAAAELLAELAGQLDLTVHMGMLEDGMVTYVAKHVAPNNFTVGTRVGSQLEAYCTALGKVLISALGKDELVSFLHDGDFIALTPYTITDKDAFRRELTKVREVGYAIDDREMIEDVRCVAVPVRDASGAVVAAISGSDRADRMDQMRQAEIMLALRTASLAITRIANPALLAANDTARGANRFAYERAEGALASQ